MRTLSKLALGYLFALSCAAQAQSYVPGEVIVKIKRSSPPSAGRAFAAKMRSQNGMKLKNHFAALNLYHFSLPQGQSVESAIHDLSQHPDVEYSEPNYIIHKASVGGVQRTFSAQQMQMADQSGQVTSANIGLSKVYEQSSASGGYVGALSARPIVAVIDTGLDTTHYVFQQTQAVWTNPNEIPNNGIDDDHNGFVDDVNGWNFVTGTGQMYDDDGHGTHVSGIVLSLDQNIFGSTFQTAKIQIMPLKFLDSTGSGATSDAIKAIYYAIQNGATVLNNSWGGTDYSSALNEAIAYSYNAGATFVAAAGNSGTDNDSSPMYPSGYDVPNILAVAAITDTDDLASFSNYGVNSVALGSPGVYILSTLPGNQFGEMSGTSMATPFVSGTAAQMKVLAPNMLGYQVRSLIMGKSTTVAGLVNRVETNGMLDTVDSINAASTAPIQTSQPAYQMTYQPDRSLASNLAGGGCGLVSTMMHDRRGPPDQGLGAIAVTLILVLLPVAYLFYRRMRNPANRRRFERFRIASEVRINVGDKELVGSVSSISLGGARINTSALLQDGGMVTLTIESPDGLERVEVGGRVVWSEANKAYGVAFSGASESVLTRISQWTKALQRAS